ncbi:hypothetical protein LQW54_004687 [Pestalotiopsis sp. IQ-011]
MRLRKAARVILVGAPGVGKGTQSERLLDRFPQLTAISSGDLLRNNVKNRTPLGIKVESTMKTGGLVPDDMILRLITNELGQRGWLSGGRANVMTLASSGISATGAAEAYEDLDPFISAIDRNPAAGASLSAHASEDPTASFLLDGFPRTAPQAEKLDDIVPINWAVSIKTPFDVIMQRISSRWVHEPSGRVYNTTFHAPKVHGVDDVTGEPLVQRSDDNEDVYRARFKKFKETSEPLLEHYAKKGVLWEVEGMSSDEISPKLYAEFERRFA